MEERVRPTVWVAVFGLVLGFVMAGGTGTAQQQPAAGTQQPTAATPQPAPGELPVAAIGPSRSGPPKAPLVVELENRQKLRVTPIAHGLTHPWGMTFLPDGKTLLVTERAGRLRVIRNGVLDPTPVAGVPKLSNAYIGGLQDVASDDSGRLLEPLRLRGRGGAGRAAGRPRRPARGRRAWPPPNRLGNSSPKLRLTCSKKLMGSFAMGMFVLAGMEVRGDGSDSILARPPQPPAAAFRALDAMESRSSGLLIVLLGAAVMVVGLLVWSGALSWFGRLPGDIRIERQSVRFYFPITSMILLSLALGCGLVAGYGPAGPTGYRPGFGWYFGGDAAINSLAMSSTGLWSLADDSGLEIEALGGRPGVLSARYGGDDLSFPEKMRIVLDEMADAENPNRGARFVCAMALAEEAGRIRISTEGECRGRIAPEPRGMGGFGYDPVPPRTGQRG